MRQSGNAGRVAETAFTYYQVRNTYLMRAALRIQRCAAEIFHLEIDTGAIIPYYFLVSILRRNRHAIRVYKVFY
jgi:hypothetical protein